MTIPGGAGIRAILIRPEPREASIPLIHRRIGSSTAAGPYRGAKLHSTDAGDVPTPQFKRGAVQEMYCPFPLESTQIWANFELCPGSQFGILMPFPLSLSLSLSVGLSV